MPIEQNTHHIRRARLRLEVADGMKVFFITGTAVEPPLARKSNDVDLIYHSRISWEDGIGTPLEILDYPKCPGCGGKLEWVEARGVPGIRKCDGCGARYVDTTYGIASEVPN